MAVFWLAVILLIIGALAVTVGMKSFFRLTLVAVLAGLWFLVALPREVMLMFMGKDLLATVVDGPVFCDSGGGPGMHRLDAQTTRRGAGGAALWETHLGLPVYKSIGVHSDIFVGPVTIFPAQSSAMPLSIPLKTK